MTAACPAAFSHARPAREERALAGGGPAAAGLACAARGPGLGAVLTGAGGPVTAGLLAEIAGPCLEMPARPGAVPLARHHARRFLADAGLSDASGPVELVVSEIVTNAVRACGGLDARRRAGGGPAPVIRLWLAVAGSGVLVAAWDPGPGRPERQEAGPDAERGRGLLLIEAITAAWGSSALAGEPGKVVWALCQD
jgi:anti-sigma regulatory factor (Ser/Thr protein kinase)